MSTLAHSLWGMICEPDYVCFNVLGEAGWLVGWIPWNIYIKTFFEFLLSNWTSCLIKQWMFMSKCEKFGLTNVMASLVS
jgi:hypothetical protein